MPVDPPNAPDSADPKIKTKSAGRAKRKAPAKKPVSRADRLARLGLIRPIDFITHLPLRYEDETRIVSIAYAAQTLQPVQVEGVVIDIDVAYRPRRQLVVSLEDDSGQLTLRFLNFYGNQITQMAVGKRLRVRGQSRTGFFGVEMVHPAYQVVQPDTPLPDTLTPVYAAGEGVSQALLRERISGALALERWEDTLPALTVSQLELMPFDDAVRLLHRPPAEVDDAALMERSHPAWNRIKFDELLAQQLSLQRSQLARRRHNARALSTVGVLSTALRAALPFALTAAQERVVGEISVDLMREFPMHRLLQGDVGSGKTVVAALAAAQAIDSGFQAALMAPTEILAEQHFRKIADWLAPLGVEVAWLSGSQTRRARQQALEKIESGAARLAVGTHALIQDDVFFEKLGLVIVDEQHRFGVGQRLALRNKAASDMTGEGEAVPHQLMMTATPIPRTLGMTYYADLDLSAIDELPPGRSPVLTRAIDAARRHEVIERVRAKALEGRQIYWVCPLIEESDVLQLQTANDTYAMLQEALPDLQVGLIHGKLKSADKQAVMRRFVSGDIQLLVATTVIEVGVDVPNASLMVIEHAERFGLSQLHQLRGRVGRGAAQSVCVLLYQSPLGQIARQRLMIMRSGVDGFAIAQADLDMRGPGEFLGARQSGQALLRFADLEADHWLVQKARELAHTLVHHDDPVLQNIAENHLARWLGAREDYLKA